MPFLSVKVASKMSGVSAHTLRAWERRYKAVTPKRSETGRRVYTYKDVERLGMLNKLVELGHAISSVANLPDAQLREMIGREAKKNAATVAPTSGAQEVRHWIDALVEDVEQFRLDRLNKNLSETRFHLSTRDFVLRVIPPVFEKVGDRVACEKMSVAQEHAFSAVLRDHLGQIFRTLEQNVVEDPRKCVVLATPEGEQHEFGALLSAILCAIHGYTAHYLGPSLPARDLAYAAGAVNASIVILGTSPASGDGKSFEFSRYLSRLKKGLPDGAEIWLGGKGIPPRNQLRVKKKPVMIDTLEELNRLLESR